VDGAAVDGAAVDGADVGRVQGGVAATVGLGDGSDSTGPGVVVDGCGVVGSGDGSSEGVGVAGTPVVGGVVGVAGVPGAPGRPVPDLAAFAGFVGVGVVAELGGLGSGSGADMALARPPDPTRKATVVRAAKPCRWK
jgi:hypothetical protein